jgi:hypothetical protein
LTRLTPFGVELASVCAARMESAARANAVWKPKLWSMYDPRYPNWPGW